MDKAYAIFAKNRLKWTGRAEECSKGRCDKRTRWILTLEKFTHQEKHIIGSAYKNTHPLHTHYQQSLNQPVRERLQKHVIMV